MELQTLSVNVRKDSGKGKSRQARAKGLVPGIVYGGDAGPVAILVNLKDFERLVHSRSGEHSVVQLAVDGEPGLNSPALLKAVQRDPIKDHILHADFLRIRLDERIETVVPIILTGQPAGVLLGGVLEHSLRELEIECLALEVPDKITVDVAGLGLGDSLHVGGLAIPENVTVLTDADRVVAAVHIPRALTETTGAEEEGEGEGEGEGDAEKTGKTEKKAEPKKGEKKD
jgi:large subunit ribosomal protein L25